MKGILAGRCRTPQGRPDSSNSAESGSQRKSGGSFDEAEARELGEVALKRDPDGDGTARQTAAIFASPDRTAALRSVHVPTLVVHGLEDTLVAPSGGIATARAVPGARLLMFPDMGHNLPRARWAETVGAIAANTRRASPRALADA